jgi:hypothetical protein
MKIREGAMIFPDVSAPFPQGATRSREGGDMPHRGALEVPSYDGAGGRFAPGVSGANRPRSGSIRTPYRHQPHV